MNVDLSCRYCLTNLCITNGNVVVIGVDVSLLSVPVVDLHLCLTLLALNNAGGAKGII